MKKVGLLLALTLALTACGGTDAPKEEKLTGSADGMGGTLKVEVTVEGDKIKNVEVTEHKETPDISDPALNEIPGKIVEANSTDVDDISGATITSQAIRNAVDDALAQKK